MRLALRSGSPLASSETESTEPSCSKSEPSDESPGGSSCLLSADTTIEAQKVLPHPTSSPQPPGAPLPPLPHTLPVPHPFPSLTHHSVPPAAPYCSLSPSPSPSPSHSPSASPSPSPSPFISPSPPHTPRHRRVCEMFNLGWPSPSSIHSAITVRTFVLYVKLNQTHTILDKRFGKYLLINLVNI